VVGKGPHGEPLYAAEWYREPTDAQLRSELVRQSGYGLIACRTVANYRVEDCQELAQYPRGSRLSGAAREAAWQFRVRPPRVGGKSLVGAWVRIRIDYRIRMVKADGSDADSVPPGDR
jgi:protein TonB